ncbi:MAG: response regulator [Planctomycetota bacterium]|nr:response regulator [Planctomycetota bacterium]
MTASEYELTTADDVEVDISGCSILVVDDNAQNLELVEAYLESLPCKVTAATDGAMAIERIRALQPDLVLLDVMMPKMSGFEVCRLVKGEPTLRSTVIIMVTALHEVADLERAVECGCDDFISKPVNKVELITRVRGLLKVRVLKRTLAEYMRTRGGSVS